MLCMLTKRERCAYKGRCLLLRTHSERGLSLRAWQLGALVVRETSCASLLLDTDSSGWHLRDVVKECHAHVAVSAVHQVTHALGLNSSTYWHHCRYRMLFK
jgi:hypothetical protein